MLGKDRVLAKILINAVILGLTLPAATGAWSAPRDSTGVMGSGGLENYQGIPIGKIYCSGNGRTRARVILQEMLVQPGDPLDVGLVRETERNLRTLQYLGTVRIIPRPDPAAGTVDLEVAVTDTWPWVGAVIPSFAGGQREVFVIVANGNVRGMGQEGGVFAFLSNEVADSYSFFFRERRLFGSRWSGAFQVGRQGNDGNQNGIEFSRPLYSLSTPWAYNLSAFDETNERILYESGVEVSDYFRKRRGVRLGTRRSFLNVDRRFELGLQYTYLDDRYKQEEGWRGVIPENKERGQLVLEASAEQFRFAEDRFINQMGQVEDQRLGIRGAIRLGGSARFLGSDRNYPVLGAGFRWLAGDPGAVYFLAESNVNTRFDENRFANIVSVSTLRVYRRLVGNGLFAWQGQLSLLDRMEDPDQLLLDSPNGLRGYEANSYEGTRRIVTNFEWRQPVWDLGWVVLGSAVFADGGIIWSEGLPLRDAPFLVGAGAGVRIGFPGFLGAPVMRLDLGYGFRPRSTEFSFGFGQRFGDDTVRE